MKKLMNILILSNSHPFKTAGIVAKDLLDAFRKEENVNIKLIVGIYDIYKDKDIISIKSFTSHFIALCKKKMRSLLRIIGLKPRKKNRSNSDYSIQDYDQTCTFYDTDKILWKAGIKPDVIIVLFMQHFLSFRNLYELNKFTSAPILLYMPDMAAMTGGCHYAWDCKGYIKSCGNCPAMCSDNENDQSRRNWEYKHEYVEKTTIFPIAGTEWQYRQLLQSSLYSNKPKSKVLLPINDLIFSPGGIGTARTKLKLPPLKKIIFFGSNSVNIKRKGFTKLLEALVYLETIISIELKNNIHLVIAGGGKLNLKKEFPFSHSRIGHLSHNDLANAFRAADVFVSPSIEDSGPMMVNQSIMCGTPVVSFETGVALDLVHTGITGYRAKTDIEDFAKGIHFILKMNQSEYEIMRNECRALGLRLSNSQIHVDSLLKIIHSLLKNVK